MGEEFSGSALVSGDSIECLEKLSKEDILEILCEGEGFCGNCQTWLRTRIQNYINDKNAKSPVSSGSNEPSEDFWSSTSSALTSLHLNRKSPSKTPELVPSATSTSKWGYSGPRRGYANASITQSPASSVPSKTTPGQYLSPQVKPTNHGLVLEDGDERARIAKIGRKKNFSHFERVDGVKKNVLEGLELHTGVFNAEDQKQIVDCVYNLQRMGQRGQLKERTYLEPKKWMRGKGRVTIQFGCCYNYAKDKYGNPPGISRDEEVDPLPPLFKQMIKRMVRWQVLPSSCIPDSCIVNIYNAGDCIPPHIDHHDFLRPFCTVSFLSECNILFGTSLKVVDEGVFDGPVSVPLPVGSVLILSGNGSDIAKHCVPSVPTKRISITFRKMDDRKLPYKYLPDPELVDVKPFVHSLPTSSRVQQNQPQDKTKARHDLARGAARPSIGPIFNKEDDFPALGSSSFSRR